MPKATVIGNERSGIPRAAVGTSPGSLFSAPCGVTELENEPLMKRVAKLPSITFEVSRVKPAGLTFSASETLSASGRYVPPREADRALVVF